MKVFTAILAAGMLMTAAGDVTRGGFGAEQADEKRKPAGTKKVEQKGEKKAQAGAKRATYPFYGTLDSVDGKEKRLILRGKKKNRVILFTSETRVQKDGAKASIQEAAAGERVSGSVRKNAEGKEEAVTIRFGSKQAGE